MNFQSLLLSESERYPQQHPSDNADDYGHDLALQALVSQQIQDDLAQNQRSGSATSAPMAIPSTGSSNQYGAHGVGPNAPLCGVGFVGGVGFDVDDDDLDLDDEGDADAQAAGAGDDDDEDPLDRDPDDEVIYDDDGSSEEDSNYDSNDELEVNWTNFTYVSAPSSFGNKYHPYINQNNFFESNGNDPSISTWDGNSSGPNSRSSSGHGQNALLSVVAPTTSGSAVHAPASKIISVVPTSPRDAPASSSDPVDPLFGLDSDDQSVDPSEIPEKYLFHMIATCQAEIERRHGPTATSAAIGSGFAPNTEFVSAGTSAFSNGGVTGEGAPPAPREPRHVSRPGSTNGHGHSVKSVRKKSGSFSTLTVTSNSSTTTQASMSNSAVATGERKFFGSTMPYGGGHVTGATTTRRPQSGNSTHRHKRSAHKSHGGDNNSSRSYHNVVHDPELQRYDEPAEAPAWEAGSGRQDLSRADIPVEKMFATIVHTYHHNEANANTTEHDVKIQGLGMFSKTGVRHVPPLRLDSVPPPPVSETGLRSPRSAFDDISVCSQGSVTSNSGSTTSLSSRGSVFKPPTKSVQKQSSLQSPVRRKTPTR